ncbi:MAG: hypothetical protein A2Y38_15560 [Spirochaetes bacterium GWB1_59_5]|nr:MAG: hypothetical protein A2Y38_15560 [Spirochaetes bacterium GWB1_59_5]
MRKTFLPAIIIFFLCIGFLDCSSASESLFNGIALGDEANNLIKKYNINPAEANSSSSDETCDVISAKNLISCVWYVATCKPGSGDLCPPKDHCASNTQKNIRNQEYESCKEEAAQITKLKEWGKGVTHLVAAKQVVCSTESVYRRVMNAYLDGNKGPLRDQLGFDCRLIKNPVPAKVIGKSKDGKLFQIEYRIPYSNYTSDGWLAKGSLMTEEERKKSRL